MRLACLLLMMLVLANVLIAQTSEYVGYRYKAVAPDTMLPNGVKVLGGGLVGDIYSKPVWDVSDVSKGLLRMLWLEKSAAEDVSGVTEWKVVDVLTFPKISANEDLLFAAGDCMLKGKEADDLVVHAQLLKKKMYKTLKAWRADLKAERFVPLDAKDVKCSYDEP